MAGSEQKGPFDRHTRYFMYFLRQPLPQRVAAHDSTRGTILFFAVCGLDIIGSLHLLDAEKRKHIMDWIYGGLVESKEEEECCSGFMGSRTFVLDTRDAELLQNIKVYHNGHLALTYTSLAVLITLGDDLRRLNRKNIVDGVAAVQREDGSFNASKHGNESDIRFVFCAAAICHMLDYWGNVNKDTMVKFIVNCLRYDYGFSQQINAEGHGGTTYCALAALQLSGQLDILDECTVERIKRWLILRQNEGFNGRPNKEDDTCYSLWIGGSLRILNAFHLTDYDKNREFILRTEDKISGGFSKWPETKAETDPFHTYFGICGLALTEFKGCGNVMPSLNISMRAYEALQELHQVWRNNEVHDKVLLQNATTLPHFKNEKP